MYAYLTAVVCLLHVGAFTGSLERSGEGNRDVYVYLRQRAGASAKVIEAMREETSALMQTGSYRVQWLDSPQEVTAAFLVIVNLDGRCALDSPPQPAAKSLASVTVEGGRILPFVEVNCAGLRGFIASALGRKPEPFSLYGRALGRVLAHELYHVVGQTASHTDAGVSQAKVSVQDLVSERLTFDKDALITMHRSKQAPSGVAATKITNPANHKNLFVVFRNRR